MLLSSWATSQLHHPMPESPSHCGKSVTFACKDWGHKSARHGLYAISSLWAWCFPSRHWVVIIRGYTELRIEKARKQKAENQKSEIRNQKSEIRYQTRWAGLEDMSTSRIRNREPYPDRQTLPRLQEDSQKRVWIGRCSNVLSSPKGKACPVGTCHQKHCHPAVNKLQPPMRDRTCPTNLSQPDW